MTQTKTKNRKQIDYWQVVNVDKDNNEIIMLDYLFDDGKGFKGATGTRFEPVSKSEYEERMEDDAIIESLMDSGMDLPKDYKRTGFEGLVNDMDYGEKESCMFDTSNREHWDKLREYGYPQDEYPIFNCTGGGRMFDNKFKGNVNTNLSMLIRQYETTK